MRWIQLWLIVSFIFLNYHVSYSDACFSNEELKRITERLDKDKKIIQWQSKRWEELVNTIPEIDYIVEPNDIIIQKIKFKIKEDAPLEYELKIKIQYDTEKKEFFPFTFNLCGMIEPALETKSDIKLGIQFLSLAPLSSDSFNKFGMHLLLGAQSSGISISYKLSDFLPNTRLHVYSGISYTNNMSYGIGLSLNF